MRGRRRIVVALAGIGFALPRLAIGADPTGSKALAGLWRAKRHFGPEVSGRLTVERDGPGLRAEIDGRSAAVKVGGEEVSFELKGGNGSFRGRRKNDESRIVGHWIQPPGTTLGAPYAEPVTLVPRRDRWEGVVEPLDDAFTFYLAVKANADGTLGAFLRNPERNLGRFLDVQHAVLEGATVKLLGKRSKDGPEVALAEGPWDADTATFSLPLRGGTYDFARASAADEEVFYPRGKPPVRYAYRPPPAEDDGWTVGRLAEVGISRDAIARFVQMLLDTPIDSVHAPDIHGLLIARHGKLVVEEYFHGFHRDVLHDTRSASKSITSVLTGAAILRGEPVAIATPVEAAMDAGRAAAERDPRKRAITIEHLLTMSSGLDCDDSNPDSPGNEDVMQSQTAQPDWYRYTLDRKMVRPAGQKAVYGSANPNLLGGVLARKTGRWLPDLFRDLVAEPLQIRRYALNLTPTGDAYMGGGARLRLRDFVKIGQMMLDGGRWNGREVVSAEWAKASISPRYDLNGMRYGYLWWVTEYPYGNRTVRAFFAGGNGGQIVIGVPDLDLVVGFYGGNYSDAVALTAEREYVPRFILPAIPQEKRPPPT